MRYLRTASTQRLLAVLAGLVVAIGGGTALAVAASSSDPVPKAESLPVAVHDALTAAPVQGISADVTFSNHLIDASSIQSSDPILTGASGRLWVAKDHLRLELKSTSGDAQVVVNGSSFWISVPATQTVYEGTIPASTAKDTTGTTTSAIPTVAEIQTELTKLMDNATVSGATPSDVAGQPTYKVSISPKHDAGLLGSAELEWDAATGVPLRVAVYASNSSTPVLELKATDVSYGAVPASDFAVAPLAGYKVVKVATGQADAQASAVAKTGKHAHQATVHGVAAVSAKLPFPLVAPSTLVALPRQDTTLLDWGGTPAALVTYGHGLGAIAVIEQTAAKNSSSSSSSSSSDSGKSALSLPTVSINGATGTELDTALGTVVRFTRNGVAYTVLGSVLSAAADAAAQAL